MERQKKPCSWGPNPGLLPHGHVCLPAATVPTMTVTDSNLLKLTCLREEGIQALACLH